MSTLLQPLVSDLSIHTLHFNCAWSTLRTAHATRKKGQKRGIIILHGMNVDECTITQSNVTDGVQ